MRESMLGLKAVAKAFLVFGNRPPPRRAPGRDPGRAPGRRDLCFRRDPGRPLCFFCDLFRDLCRIDERAGGVRAMHIACGHRSDLSVSHVPLCRSGRLLGRLLGRSLGRSLGRLLELTLDFLEQLK